MPHRTGPGALSDSRSVCPCFLPPFLTNPCLPERMGPPARRWARGRGDGEVAPGQQGWRSGGCRGSSLYPNALCGSPSGLHPQGTQAAAGGGAWALKSIECPGERVVPSPIIHQS